MKLFKHNLSLKINTLSNGLIIDLMVLCTGLDGEVLLIV